MIENITVFCKSFLRREDGAAAIEFALIAIPFLILMFGVMEAGRVVWMYNGVQYTVEETNRYASVNSDLSNSDFQVYAQDKLEEMFVPSESLLITTNNFTTDGVDFVEIEGAYEVSTMLAGFIPGEFGNFSFRTSSRKPVLN